MWNQIKIYIQILGNKNKSKWKELFDTIGVEQKLKEQVKKLKWICKKNHLKGYAFYEIYINSVVRY